MSTLVAAPEFADEAEQLIAALGDTPREMYRSLLASGVRGTPGSATECVIANLLRRHGLPVAEVQPADEPHTGVVEFEPVDGCQPRRLHLSLAANALINGFDKGKFRRLRAKAVPA